MAFGDGDWQERLEAVFRKYETQASHEDAAHEGAARLCAQSIMHVRDMHIHIHVYPPTAPSPASSVIVRPLARRAMARDAA